MNSQLLWRPAKVLVLFLLTTYFIIKIIDSLKKWQDKEIAVSLESIREELVEERALCITFLRLDDPEESFLGSHKVQIK